MPPSWWWVFSWDSKKKMYRGSNGGQVKEGSKRQRTRSQTTFYQEGKAWLRMWWRAAGRETLIPVTVSPSRGQRLLLTRGVNHKGSKDRGAVTQDGPSLVTANGSFLLWLSAGRKKKDRVNFREHLTSVLPVYGLAVMDEIVSKSWNSVSYMVSVCLVSICSWGTKMRNIVVGFSSFNLTLVAGCVLYTFGSASSDSIHTSIN